MKKLIKVRAIEGFQMFNHDETVLEVEVDEDDELEAELYEETEEYFAKDKRGREVYVGELDVSGQLQLDDCFILI